MIFPVGWRWWIITDARGSFAAKTRLHDNMADLGKLCIVVFPAPQDSCVLSGFHCPYTLARHIEPP